jgi:hypothetical protein
MSKKETKKFSQLNIDYTNISYNTMIKHEHDNTYTHYCNLNFLTLKDFFTFGKKKNPQFNCLISKSSE